MKQLKRKDNWPEILAEEIKKASNKPFKYGRHDCCLFGANILRAMTGTDLAKGLRGYTTALGANKTIKKNGGTLTKMLDAIMKRHNCESVKWPMCKRGDLVIALIENEEGKKERAIGICLGSEAAFAGDGIQLMPMRNVVRGWRCG